MEELQVWADADEVIEREVSVDSTACWARLAVRYEAAVQPMLIRQSL